MEILVTFVSVNARGQAQRDQRRLAGPQLSVGRGTQCQIHLPDPRVALSSTEITVTEQGAAIRSEPGSIQVNGRPVDGTLLAVGDRVEIGPYLLEVGSPPPGVGLALTVTLVSPLAAKAPGALGRVLRQSSRISKRRLSYIAFGGVLMLCLFAPIIADLLEAGTLPPTAPPAAPDMMREVARVVSAKFIHAWNPGPVSRSHQIFSDDCQACHQLPFVQVRDAECITCHQSVAEHVNKSEPAGERGVAFSQTRCAECHRDHKGMEMAPRAQEQCADCHSSIRSTSPKGQSANVTDFATDHPPFRLSMLNADGSDAITRVRQVKSGSAGIAEHSNLKFNHKLHLSPAGVRDPQGKRPAARTADSGRRRTVLKCADCHESAEGGRLMAPVTMELHCQRCHSLAFEPKVTDRQVPHGSEKEIATMLREFFARMALGDAPPQADSQADPRRARPGEVLTYEDRQRTLQIAERKAKLVLRELFEIRGVCTTCHEVSRAQNDAGWQVAPVRVARVWMPRALFSHAKHSSQRCETCHDAAVSTTAAHVSMPDVGKCRECHTGARAVAGKVTSDCATCHKFHSGRDYWHGALQTQMQRGAK